jgi:hypothetical protein
VAVPTKLPSLMALRLDFVTATTLVFLVRAMVAVVPSIVVDGHRVRTDGIDRAPDALGCWGSLNHARQRQQALDGRYHEQLHTILLNSIQGDVAPGTASAVSMPFIRNSSVPHAQLAALHRQP